MCLNEEQVLTSLREMKQVLICALALSAHAFAPARPTLGARTQTIAHESFGLPGAEDPNENTDERMLGEARYKKEFIKSYAPDATLLKEGFGGIFAASKGLSDRRVKNDARKAVTGIEGLARIVKNQAGDLASPVEDGAAGKLNLLSFTRALPANYERVKLFGVVETPIAIDKATVNPTLLGVILSANLVAVALFAGEMSGVSLGSLTAALPAAAPVA